MKDITTTKFEAEVRVDMMVPTADIAGPFRRGDDITSLIKADHLNGYPDCEVVAFALGEGKGKRTKVAFLWRDGADAEYWYVGRKVKGGMSPERAEDAFYGVVQNLLD